MTLTLSSDDLSRVRAAFSLTTPVPVAVAPALPEDAAERAIGALLGADGWQREHFVEDFLGGTRKVDADTFAAAPPLSRFASWTTLDMVHVAELGPLASLLAFLSSGRFLATLESLGRPGVAPPEFKLRRYGPGDFFAPHSDGARGLGLLIHWTVPPWQPGDGGRLIYEPRGQPALSIPPVFNSAVFLPYTDDATHQVEPVMTNGSVRYTLGCDYA